MTTDDLRAIAEAATPGPWHHGPLRGEVWVWRGGAMFRRVASAPTPMGKEADARHIATFDPRRALALLDVRDALRRVLSAERHMVYGPTGEFTPCPCDVCVPARAALARLEALA